MCIRDRSLTNPEVMGKLWLKITKFINSKDPYKTIKKAVSYTHLVLQMDYLLEVIWIMQTN